IGSINASLAPIQNIMKSAMLCNAAAILLVHNHPSGSPAPSKEDMQLTEKVVEAGKLMELPLLDHVIIGSGDRERYSFREANPQMFEGAYRKEVLEKARVKKHREMER
ncbi:MAG: JAB domain-containing protein, partial [Lachnospiraceae bacterium]|nr:JAB domain-containing protein [Lachnospiraceae bacterium]